MRLLLVLLLSLYAMPTIAQPVIYGMKLEVAALQRFSPNGPVEDVSFLSNYFNMEWDESTRSIWTAGYSGLIRISENGSRVDTVIAESAYHPADNWHAVNGIVIDHDAATIYASGDGGWGGNYYVRANIDGSDPEIIRDFARGGPGFSYLYLDRASGVAYGAQVPGAWFNVRLRSAIVTVDLPTGTVLDTVAVMNWITDWDLDPIGRQIYWSERDSLYDGVPHHISRLSLDTGEIEPVINRLDHLYSIAVDGLRRHLYVSDSTATYVIDLDRLALGDTTYTAVGPGGLRNLLVVETGSVATEHLLPEAATWSVYPNPSDGAATISFSGVRPTQIEVFDIMGRVVARVAAHGSDSAHLSGLSPGVYFLRAGAMRSTLVVSW